MRWLCHQQCFKNSLDTICIFVLQTYELSYRLKPYMDFRYANYILNACFKNSSRPLDLKHLITRPLKKKFALQIAYYHLLQVAYYHFNIEDSSYNFNILVFFSLSCVLLELMTSR